MVRAETENQSARVQTAHSFDQPQISHKSRGSLPIPVTPFNTPTLHPGQVACKGACQPRFQVIY